MIAVFKEEIPFLRLLIPFIAGIYVSTNPFVMPSAGWYYCFILAFIFATTLCFVYKKIELYDKRLLLGLNIKILVFLSAIILTHQHKEIYAETHFSKIKSDYIIVHINEEPKIKGDIARFIAVTDAVVYHKKIMPASGNILLAMRFDTTKRLGLKYGYQLIIKSKYKDIEPPYNPAEFNYKKLMANRQVYHQTFINQLQTVKIDSNKGNPIINFALNFREKQVDKFRKHIPNIDARSVASTLLLGYRTELEENILNAYFKTGTIHVLSVSGMHVALVVLLLEFLLKFMNHKRWTQLLKAVIMLTLVWFYALIAGMAPSVARAAIMITLYVIAKLIRYRGNTFNIMGIAAFIILLYNPFIVMDVGFQLSFISVAGLIYLQPKIQNLYSPENKILQLLWGCISISIAAQLATTPISVFYFHLFPLCFIISNLFILLPATLIMYGGIMFLVIPWPTTVMHYAGLAFNYLINFTNNGLIHIGNMPGATISPIYFNALEILLFYAALFFMLKAFSQKQKRFIYAAIFLLSIFTISITIKNVQHSIQKQAMFFCLRKNTAVALIRGKTAVLITDVDSSNYNYKFFVKPYLDSCRINNILFINPSVTDFNTLYTYNNKTIMVQQNKQFSPSNNKIDYILLSTNKILNLQPLTQYNFKHLFIDGKNKDYIIENLTNQAKHLHLPFSVLKRKYAVEIKL
ncbi:MAG: ComEC family competence protein [Sphingobacteriales bacterium]|nr:MAG: ComEC family competence protein [Sphingobacteriales bacterium]TAF80853.1 MAG: ComEC family competence protein [Sphingobacteriales bacterium]